MSQGSQRDMKISGTGMSRLSTIDGVFQPRLWVFSDDMKDIRDKRDIVLFLPRKNPVNAGTEQLPPLQLLALARVLIGAGYNITIIDATVEEDYLNKLIKHCEGALCLGVSCIIGYPVYHGSKTARMIRERYPELPVVFGGWFPSVEPELFLKEGIADVVVRGQGERTFLELVEAFRHSRSIEPIVGISYKKDGRIVHNPDRPMEDINNFPPMPYHLVDIERYIASDPNVIDTVASNKKRLPAGFKFRVLHYFSSVGCPDNCKFCCSPGVTKRKWMDLEPVRMAKEIEDLVRRYRFNFLIFLDPNFFVSEKRVRAFCEEMVKRDLRMPWNAFGEARPISRYNRETLDALKHSGCCEVFIGAESASDETLRLMDKHIYFKEVEQCVDLLVSRDIIPRLAFIIGFPDESEKAIDETLQAYYDLRMKYPTVDLRMNIFFPLPSSGFYSRAVELGFNGPRTLEEWGFISRDSIKVMTPIPNCLTGEQLRRLFYYRDIYFKFGFDILWEKPCLGLIETCLHKSARFRLKHNMLELPVEFWLYKKTQKLKHLVIRR